MAKKEEVEVCPKCGCKSWISTTQGIMCRDCKYVKGSAPVVREIITKQ